MGGIGKTTLAQLAYNDERIMSHFDLRIWVSVNNTFSFNVRKVITNILDYATRVNCESSQLGVLQSSLQESLRGKKYLLVLDDLWNQNLHEWEKLRNPLTRRATDGSKIIVTTRNNVVADVMSTTLPYTLEALTDEDCWNLFKQQSFSEGEETSYPNLVSIGRQIVNKCRGVPLAAKVLGTLMRFKRDESEWLYVQESELSDLCDHSILPILRLSYNHLPPYLKRCFEYCAVFPKGYEINKEKLIHQWIAEGLIQSPGDGISSKKMEDTGNDYFKDLLSMSFFQVVREGDDGDITEFKMHDLIHDLAKHITRNEILILRHNHPPLLSWANHAQIRHVSVEGNFNSLLLLGASFGAKKLRSLNLLSPGDDSGKALPTLIPHLRHLRVLNLSECGIKLIHKSIGDLMLLRYLDLSNTTLQRLPESVCHLCNLQTLNLLGCKDLVELPSGTSNLINLRHLNIKDCVRLTSMPDNLGKLRNLQTLPTFIIGHTLEKSLFQLVHLELRGELQIKRLENVGKIVMDLCLVNKQLHSLSLSWGNDNEGNLDHHSSGQIVEECSSNVENMIRCLQPNSNLKKLSLKEYLGMMFPQWMNHATLPNLTKLVLINCRGCKNLPSLGQLQFLKVLTMQGMDSVGKIGGDFYGKESRNRSFPSLNELTLIDFPELGTWESMDSTEAFLCLYRLTIIKCPKLTNMPRFPSLFHLELRECNAPILGSAAELDSLSSLVIDTFPELLSIPEALFQNNLFLTSLTVSSCPQLRSLHPRFAVFAALKSLTIHGCHELETALHELLQLTCLENLEIVECPCLDSLPEKSFRGLKSLQSLHIQNL
ncbi:hypothetical protein ACSBR1_000748 [Camellia fascicularis]